MQCAAARQKNQHRHKKFLSPNALIHNFAGKCTLVEVSAPESLQDYKTFNSIMSKIDVYVETIKSGILYDYILYIATVCRHDSIYIYIYIYVYHHHVYMYIYIYIHTYVNININMYIYIYVCIYTYIYMYIYMCMCIKL
jgi:hypothetical protein